jgi:hypothetical protein
MIAVAVTIVLVILVLANVGLKLFNYLYPPCDGIYEYFEAAKMMPDGAATSLASIPPGISLNYVGAKPIVTDKPGVIGLTSHVSSNKPHHNPIGSKKLYDVVNNMFPTRSYSKQHDGAALTKSIAGYKGTHNAMFETEMEGLKASSSHRNPDSRTMKPSGFVGETKRDGYKDR